MSSWKRRGFGDTRGTTLVEVIVVVGLLAVTGAAFMSMVSYQNRISKLARAQQGRDVTVSTLRNLLSNPGVLYWSALIPGNPNSQFTKCVLGDSAATCAKGTNYPLTLYYPNSSTVLAGSALPSSQPVYYDHLNAEPCDAQAAALPEACPLAVTTYFRARCPLDENNCKQAQFVQIVIDIKNRVKTSGVQGEGAIISSLRDIHDEVIVDTSQIALYKSQDDFNPNSNDGCAPGEVALGVDGLGNIFCQKLDFACPTGYYTVGVDRYFRPIYDLGSRAGEFSGTGQEVRCKPLDCGSNIMVSMFNSSGQLAPECLDSNRTCSLSDAQILTSINVDGQPNCTFIDVCDEVNRSGTEMSKKNFTRGFQRYNGEFTGVAGAQVGIVKSYCEPFGCGLGQYMERFEQDGQCRSMSGGWAPPAPTPSPQVLNYYQTGNSGSISPSGGKIVYPGSGSVVVRHHWATSDAIGIIVRFRKSNGSCSGPNADGNWYEYPIADFVLASGTKDYTQNASDWNGCVFEIRGTAYNSLGQQGAQSGPFYQCWGSVPSCP